MKRLKNYLNELSPKNWTREYTGIYTLTIWVSILCLLLLLRYTSNYTPSMSDVLIMIIFTFAGMLTGYFFGKHMK